MGEITHSKMENVYLTEKNQKHAKNQDKNVKIPDPDVKSMNVVKEAYNVFLISLNSDFVVKLKNVLNQTYIGTPKNNIADSVQNHVQLVIDSKDVLNVKME